MALIVEADGSLRLPPELCRALGLAPGAGVIAEVNAGRILVRPVEAAPESAGAVKQAARDLADSMRGIAAPALPTEAPGGSAVSGVAPDAWDRQRSPWPSFHGRSPSVPASCYVAPGATIIGDVVLGEDCSVWPGAVLRGDVNRIRIGAGSNVQEAAVLHVNHGDGDCVVGSGVTIGHQATVHACTVADHVLIGIHSVILDGARVGERCIVGAGAVVTPATEIPPGKLVLGVPAKPVRDLTPAEIESVLWHAEAYVSLKEQYRNPEPPPATLTAPAPPRPGELPRYEVRRVAAPIRVDGALTDPAWGSTTPLSPLQLSTGAGAPSLATEVRARWDDECLYVAFSCHDDDIWGTHRERDQPLYEEEVVEVFLCPTSDLARYFEIEVSPLGTIFDAAIFNPDLQRRTMLVDSSWNALGMRAAAAVSGSLETRDDVDLGWTVELAIPFTDLGLASAPAPGTIWRANFFRIEQGRVEEYSAWSPTCADPPDFHLPSFFGELVFTS